MSTVQLETIDHVIGGATTAGASTRSAPVYDPATGHEQRRVLLGEASDVDAAVQAAKAAFTSWSDQSVVRRARVMFAFRELIVQHTDELARLISSEHGKTFDDAKGEVIRGMEVVEYACGIAELLKGEFSDQVSTDVDLHSFRQPLGVCAGITPFNFPIMVPLWMHPMAIATGNTFVLKPSERDPSVSNAIAELYQQAGLPDGVFNVVHGDKVAVDALLDHPDVAAISFVGSTPIAKYIHERASAAGKRVQALGGAKNHAIVMPDADLDFAANHLTAAGFGSAGQRCMAISVAVAVGDAADELVEKLRAKAIAVKVGPGLEPGSEMGPVVTGAARDRIFDYIGRGEGDVVVDGRELEIEGDGFWVGPTLIDNVQPGQSVYTDEIFGPVLARRPRGLARGGDRARQRQPVRQRHRDLHRVRSGRAHLPAQDPGRDDRGQRADPGPDELLLLRRLEAVAVRRPPHPRPRGHPLLHARQGRHDALARVAGPGPHALPDGDVATRGRRTGRPGVARPRHSRNGRGR